MGFDRKTEAMADFIFELFDLGTFEFDNLLAILANDVVMMGMAGVIGVVEFVVFAEIHFANQATLSEQGQSAIDRGARNRFVLLARPGKELVRGEMFLGAEGRVDDRLTLCGETQVAV